MKLCRISFTATLSALAFLAACSVHAKDRDREDRERLYRQQLEEQQHAEANRLRAEADQAYQHGEYAKVIAVSDQLIQSYPKDNVHVAYHMRASARIELGRAAGAAKQVREGIADARTALGIGGNKYFWLYIPYFYGLTSLAEIEKRPDHAELAIKVAGPVLARPVDKDFTADDHANLLYQRALAHTAKNDRKSAIQDYAKAIELSPDHLGSHLNLAESYAALGQTKEALAAYDAAVYQLPNTLLVFNDRGKFRRIQGDLDGATADFTRALELDPKFAIGYLNRGMCLTDQNSPEAAEGDFTEALKLPLDTSFKTLAYRLRGLARLASGHAQTAVEDLSAAIRLAPRDGGLYEERGFALFFLKDFAKAGSDFAKAAQLNPQYVRAVPWQFTALARGGQAAEGRTALETASNGKTPPTGWTVKLVGFLLGQLPEQELLEAASETKDGGETARLCEAHFAIGQKLLVAGEQDQAETHFRAAVGTKNISLLSYRGAQFELGMFAKR